MATGRAVNIRDGLSSESLTGQIGFADGAEVLRRSLLKAFPELDEYPDSIVGQGADFSSVIDELTCPPQA